MRDAIIQAERLKSRLMGLEDGFAACDSEIAELKNLLQAASHALRSYQYGNASPDLAKSCADKIDQALAAPTSPSHKESRDDG